MHKAKDMGRQYMNYWQHLPENITPNIFEIGSFQLRYYSLMYLAAIVTVYCLVLYRIKRDRYAYTKETILDYFQWAILGVILGGRLGYVLFYNLGYFIFHPLEIFLPFDFTNGVRYVGILGLSYHGGVIGLFLATKIYCSKKKINFWNFTDLLIPTIPLGYTLGRIGNFLNGELYGRITDVPWGMYFPTDSLSQLRHPSQLYEAFFEGIILFVILWNIRKKKYPDGFLFFLYFIGYGCVRFFIEYVRQPDEHMGFVFGNFSMGQILCFVMILIGITGLYNRMRNIKNA